MRGDEKVNKSTQRAKAEAMVGKMTLDEKVHLWTGYTYWTTYPIERFQLDECVMSDGPHGVRKVKEMDHLGQAVNERATGFPTSVAMGATWNKELLYQTGQVLGQECQGIGIDLLLGPAVNMKRSVLGGRNFEYISEDPVLAGKLGAEMVKGIQSTGTGACVKHFACNNSESNRMTLDVIIDERTLREIYLKVFEIIVKEAHPKAIMGSYNKINGEYSCENKKILTDILRNEWGYDGIVLSDWLAVDDCVKAVKAGLNLEMPGNPAVYRKLKEAVENGTLSEYVLNERVIELLTVILTLEEQRNPQKINWEKNREVAQNVAAQSMVLLKNENGLLPLNWEKLKKVALLGDFVIHPRTQGGGSSKVSVEKEENIFTALQSHVGQDTELVYAKGYEASGETDEHLLKEARKIVEDCDVVIIFAGLPESYESEGYDRNSMKMPEGHLKLIQEITKMRKDVVVILSNGSAIEMPFFQEVQAIVEAWLLGQETAEAIAKMLAGDTQPSGRMPETFPNNLEEEAANFNFYVEDGKLFYGERMMFGYRYYDKKKMNPAIPFGYGLSYTEFAYSDLKVSRTELTDQDSLQVSVKIKNTGSCAGYEVVQLYISNKQKQRLHPEKELKQFEKIYLQSGEERNISFILDKSDFQCYSEKDRRWVVEEGKYEILIGSSSRDIHCTETIKITIVNQLVGEINEKSTLEEWMNHPKGKFLAEEMLKHYRGFGVGDQGKTFEQLSYFVQRIMLEMPMPRLITASKGSFTEKELEEMVRKIQESKEEEM